MTREELRTVSWQCVHFVSASDLPPDLESDGDVVVRIEGSETTTKDHFLQSIAQAFRFPDYFGKNWDALESVCAISATGFQREGTR